MQLVSVCALTSFLLAVLGPWHVAASEGSVTAILEGDDECGSSEPCQLSLLQHRSSARVLSEASVGVEAATGLAYLDLGAWGKAELLDKFAPEFSADLVFHQPGYNWAIGTLTWTIVKTGHDAGLYLRFSRSKDMKDVAKGLMEVYDIMLNRSFITGKTTDFYQEGMKCHPGSWEKGMFMRLDLVDGPEGRDTVDGEPCTVLRSETSAGNMTLCMGSNGAARSLNVTVYADVVGSTNAPQWTVFTTMANVSLGPLAADTFAVPEPCSEVLPVACPFDGGEPFETTTVVRYNEAPGKDCGLGNKMVNSLLAALTIAPLVLVKEFAESFEYLQVFEVTMDRRWAPMQDCNFHPSIMMSTCGGGPRSAENALRIGRSSCNYMTGPLQGQCAPNDLVGSWYQYPSEAECAKGWALGFRNCTWKTNSFRLVKVDCILEKCSSSWAAEEAPYPKTLTCLQAAIQDCPDFKEEPGPTCLSKP